MAGREIIIATPEFRGLELRIRGITPLLCSNGAQATSALAERDEPSAGKKVRTPEEQFRASLYPLNGGYGFPASGIARAYDQRDPVAGVARTIANQVDPFRGYTEFEKTSLSHRSRCVFTLSSVYQGVNALLRRPQGAVDVAANDLAIAFWTRVGELIRAWGFVDEARSAHELRQEFIHTHAVALHAIGVAGAALVAAAPEEWSTRLDRLRDVDWSRENRTSWEGRAIRNGTITKAGNSVPLTANVLKRQLGLDLSDSELQLERPLLRTTEVANVAA